MVHSIQRCDSLERNIESDDTLETPEAICVNYKEMFKQQISLNLCITFHCSVAYENASFRWAFILTLHSSVMSGTLNFAMDMWPSIIYSLVVFNTFLFTYIYVFIMTS